MKQQLAQMTVDFGGLQGIGKLGLQGVACSEAPNILEEIISTTVAVMSIIAFIWFTFQLVSGALAIVNSGGDKGKLEDARNKITYGLIGVVVIVAAIFLVDLVGQILGIDTILSPADFLNNIAPTATSC